MSDPAPPMTSPAGTHPGPTIDDGPTHATIVAGAVIPNNPPDDPCDAAARMLGYRSCQQALALMAAAADMPRIPPWVWSHYRHIFMGQPTTIRGGGVRSPNRRWA